MKDDYRNTIGLSMFLSYHVDNRVTVSFQSSYSDLTWKESPYGSFSDYVIMNPYDAPYDEYGRVNKTMSWEMANPLFEAECGNYDEGASRSFTNTLSFRWDVLPGFFINGTGTIVTSRERTEKFISPESNEFKDVANRSEQGSLSINNIRRLSYEGKFVVNYAKNLGEDYLLTLHGGFDISKKTQTMDGYTAYGFYKSSLHAPNFAAGFGEGRRPTGTDDIETSVGPFINANFIMKNRYFVDGSFRRSGSSKFGDENRFAPFWSVGAGWNIHNEEFATRFGWLNTFRLRYSYGVTGNVSFAPYQAVTTYFYNGDNFYLHGIGAIPKSMGNKDLKWELTKEHNFGLNAEFWDGRISAVFDYYVKTTDDVLIDMSVPPSVGETTVRNNLGQMRNKGFEFDVTCLIVATKAWRFSLKVNGDHNKNTILGISNSLAKYNEEANADGSSAPKVLYKEGESKTAIYAVRSAGINPATGQEVFIKKNGAWTLEYDLNDKVVVGDKSPWLKGAFFPMLSYKGWQLNLAFEYNFGGQIYNTTRADNVENVNPRNNVDQRAFDQRWKNVNDIPPYLDIANASDRTNYHTTRFVEDDNNVICRNIELSYEFNPDLLKKIGFKRLRLSAGMKDPFRMSSVKFERGTDYPFSRGFTFSVSPTF